MLTLNCPLSVKLASLPHQPCMIGIYEHGGTAEDFDERFTLAWKSPIRRTRNGPQWVLVRSDECSWTLENGHGVREVIAMAAECTSLDQLARLMGFSDQEIEAGLDDESTTEGIFDEYHLARC